MLAAVGRTSLDSAPLEAYSCPHGASFSQLRSSPGAQNGSQQGPMCRHSANGEGGPAQCLCRTYPRSFQPSPLQNTLHECSFVLDEAQPPDMTPGAGETGCNVGSLTWDVKPPFLLLCPFVQDSEEYPDPLTGWGTLPSVAIPCPKDCHTPCPFPPSVRSAGQAYCQTTSAQLHRWEMVLGEGGRR